MRTISALVSLPASLLALTLAVALFQESCGYRPFWSADRLNLSEAAAARDVPEVARLLRDGADVYAGYAIRPGLIDDAARTLTPLEAAMAVNDANMMRLLLVWGSFDTRRLGPVWCSTESPELRSVLIDVVPEADHIDCKGSASKFEGAIGDSSPR